MTINAVPERADVLTYEERRTDQQRFLPPWLEFFRSIFYALFGWKRSFTWSANLNFGLIAAASEASLTVTVTGARSGDAVIVTPASKTAGIVDNFGIVTASDTVTVYAHNITGAGIDPPAKDYRVIVLQQ
jgi:hypothetical protein